jgi:hypothetical protein
MAIATNTQKPTLLEETLQQLSGCMPWLRSANQTDPADADTVLQ